MLYLGITSLGHDASVAVVEDNEIIFAGHAERYSRIKNDGNINQALLDDALSGRSPDKIIWYEQPFIKKSRQFFCGQWDGLAVQRVKKHLSLFGLDQIPVEYAGHHESHAAGGFYTSSFDDATIAVIDAIGEWTTISIWQADYTGMFLKWSQRYPHSIGLLYSAMTQRCGFKPNEEEYIMMGMAAFGDDRYTDLIKRDFIKDMSGPAFSLKENVHRGIKWWKPEITNVEHLAASMQSITEEYLCNLTKWIATNLPSKNLILSGGVALNCVANSQIAKQGTHDEIWIMPNPGDAGSSLGAIAASTYQKLNWKSPYLGHDINRDPDIDGAVQALVSGEVIGFANGRAEYGPRALGNRSLLADPRGDKCKDRVNRLKKREMFRPFAPVIIESMANIYFDMPVKSSPYMQFVAKVKRPDLYPAITHKDGTARVQTIRADQNPIFYKLLEQFYNETGCPMLLNTSLNIKGQPLVNTWEDALSFQNHYSVPVF